jgi:hypothetical protein
MEQALCQTGWSALPTVFAEFSLEGAGGRWGDAPLKLPSCQAVRAGEVNNPLMFPGFSDSAKMAGNAEMSGRAHGGNAGRKCAPGMSARGV